MNMKKKMNMMITKHHTGILDPSQSINFSFSQKNDTKYVTSNIDDYSDVIRVVSNVLSNLKAEHLLDNLSEIKVLSYPYEFITYEETGTTVVYSFAVLEGVKGDFLDDKSVVNPNTFEIINKQYVLPIDSPFIVLGYVNQNNPKYYISSIAHEISHILIDYVENNEDFISGLAKMIPNNVAFIPTDEALAIMFEIKVLKHLFNGGEIMEYLIDRYLINNNEEDAENYIKDLRALVAVS